MGKALQMVSPLGLHNMLEQYYYKAGGGPMVRKQVRRTWEVRRTFPSPGFSESPMSDTHPQQAYQSNIPKKTCKQMLKLLQSFITIRITVWIQRSRYIYIYV